jgi:hypothetical protein
MAHKTGTCYEGHMTDTKKIEATLEAGRTALVGALRTLADEIEGIPLEAPAQGLAWLWDRVRELDREAQRVFRQAS